MPPRPDFPDATAEVWRATVLMLLSHRGLDRRDQDALRRVLGWKRLGRPEEVWLRVLADEHLGRADA